MRKKMRDKRNTQKNPPAGKERRRKRKIARNSRKGKAELSGMRKKP